MAMCGGQADVMVQPYDICRPRLTRRNRKQVESTEFRSVNPIRIDEQGVIVQSGTRRFQMQTMVDWDRYDTVTTGFYDLR